MSKETLSLVYAYNEDFFFFPGKSATFKANSTADEPLSGTSGIFTYYIPSIKKKLAVMWGCPPIFFNLWNVMLFDDDITADDMFLEMYMAEDFFPGDNLPHDKLIGQGLNCTGTMSGGDDATFDITVNTIGNV